MGTLINAGWIIMGGLIGLLLRRWMHERYQESVIRALGICVLFTGIHGALSEINQLSAAGHETGATLVPVVSLAVGTLFGEWLRLDVRMQQLGNWMKNKTGHVAEVRFTEAFVTTSMTVSVGAMAVLGALRDGLTGDYSILLLKGVMDFTFVLIMTASMGRGAIFSVLPVVLIQGFFTLAAHPLRPVMTPVALSFIGLTGSMLIFCIGVNMIWPNKLKPIVMLPAVIPAAVYGMFIC